MPQVVSTPSPQSGDGTLIWAGQSNHGFYGSVADTAVAPNALFYNGLDGLWYECADSLPGYAVPPGTGTGGSIARSFAGQYNAGATKPWNRMIHATAVTYGSRSSSWVPGQSNFTHLVNVHNNLVSTGFTPSAILVALGEADNVDLFYGLQNPGDYYNNFIAMTDGLRAGGITTPIILSICSLCRLKTSVSPHLPIGPDFEPEVPADRPKRFECETQIMLEQANLIINQQGRGIYAGPNLNAISANRRWDGVHLDNYGQFYGGSGWLGKVLLYKSAGIIA